MLSTAMQGEHGFVKSGRVSEQDCLQRMLMSTSRVADVINPAALTVKGYDGIIDLAQICLKLKSCIRIMARLGCVKRWIFTCGSW